MHSLLQLGVSCTNILDEVHAMKFLWTFLSVNPKYTGIAGQSPVTEERLAEDDWKIEEIKAITDDLLMKFNEAVKTDPNDVDL
jgi:peroxin-5